MSNQSANNKRIAKNTLMMYIRMLFIMGVTLYTSRVILQVLGIEDYGIYSVVGGIVTMFTFLNGGMMSATQRYLTFELGKGNKEQLNKVFCTALQIHALISFIIVLLSETLGLWFLYEKMVIPHERMGAAMWVFQCSIIVCVVNIMSIPYNAMIIAHEKMSAFAYISVFEVILKLLIVYLLCIISWDKLVVYAILLLLVQITIRIIYSRYCNKNFPESRYKHKFHKGLFREMSSFAGWSFWGNLASILYTQGLNIMLNIFFGPVVNAARGIAVQVQSAVQQFVSNFQVALNPQITKNYAKGNLSQMHSLIFRSARFSFLLLLFITLPILIETEYILSIWLGQVPENTVIFTRLMICVALLHTFSNPCMIANQATGKVKLYQTIVGGTLLLILPVSYIFLSLGAPAYIVFIIHICVEMIAQLVRMILLKKIIRLPLLEYVNNIYLPVLIVTSISIILPIIIYIYLSQGIIRLAIVTTACLLSVLMTSIFIGLTSTERLFLINNIKSKYNAFNFKNN